MLEGALYGLDLLKLHSVTTRLVGRVDKLEEVRGAWVPVFPASRSASDFPQKFLGKHGSRAGGPFWSSSQITPSGWGPVRRKCRLFPQNFTADVV